MAHMTDESHKFEFTRPFKKEVSQIRVTYLLLMTFITNHFFWDREILQKLSVLGILPDKKNQSLCINVYISVDQKLRVIVRKHRTETTNLHN